MKKKRKHKRKSKKPQLKPARPVSPLKTRLELINTMKPIVDATRRAAARQRERTTDTE